MDFSCRFILLVFYSHKLCRGYGNARVIYLSMFIFIQLCLKCCTLTIFSDTWVHKQDPELVVETMSSNSVPKPSRPAAQSSTSSTSSNDQTQPRNSGYRKYKWKITNIQTAQRCILFCFSLSLKLLLSLN